VLDPRGHTALDGLAHHFQFEYRRELGQLPLDPRQKFIERRSIIRSMLDLAGKPDRGQLGVL
jgi:hypothetical protein